MIQIAEREEFRPRLLQERSRHERSLAGSEGIGIEQLKGTPYLGATINETLRLQPPSSNCHATPDALGGVQRLWGFGRRAATGACP